MKLTMVSHAKKSKRWRSERGQNLVETAIVLIPLLLLTFGIVDFAGLFYAYLALENGVSQATRYAVTGQTMTVTDSSGNTTTLSRLASITQALQNATPTLDVSKMTITSTNLSNSSGTATGDAGDIIRIDVTYTWNIITPIIKPFFTNGKITLETSSTMKCESWPSS